MEFHNAFRPRSILGHRFKEFRVQRNARKDAARGFPKYLKYAEARLGFCPNFENPKTYNEKIQWRKMYDRNPLFPIFSDKLRMRDEVARRLGISPEDALFPNILTSFDNPKRCALASLPEAFVAKANHASGWNIFVTKDSPLEPERFVKETSAWLIRAYGKFKLEWAYQDIPRVIVVEEHLAPEPTDKMPDEVKFVCFDGEIAFAIHEDDRFGAYTQHYVDRAWTKLPFHCKPLPKRELPEKPSYFDEMREIAEAVSKGIDHVRVDFMFTDTKMVLNEMTLYRGSGLLPFIPSEWDRIVGDKWTLPDLTTQGHCQRNLS